MEYYLCSGRSQKIDETSKGLHAQKSAIIIKLAVILHNSVSIVQNYLTNLVNSYSDHIFLEKIKDLKIFSTLFLNISKLVGELSEVYALISEIFLHSIPEVKIE